MAFVSSSEEVVGDFDKCSLCAVVGSETRLQGFKELMVGHMLLELGRHCPFQDFAEERKVGDRTVVVGVVRVQTRFFQGGDHSSSFEAGRHNTRFQRCVDDSCHDVAEGRKAGFNQGGGHGVQLARGRLGF